MSSNEEYLDSLLKSMGNEGTADPNKKMSEEEVVHTVDSIKDFSEDEIAQMLSATEEAATENGETDAAPVGLDSSDAEDLLALLDGLSDDEEISEISDLLNKDEQNELVDESIGSMWDDGQGFISEELGALLGGEEAPVSKSNFKEKKRQLREEKKLEKQRLKQQKKEERLRKKEGKKQQKEAQRLVDELEMERAAEEREAAEREAAAPATAHTFDGINGDEAVGLFDAVNTADVTDIFGAQTNDNMATSDISSLLAELEAGESGQAESEPLMNFETETVDAFSEPAASTDSSETVGFDIFSTIDNNGGEVEISLADLEGLGEDGTEKPEKKKGIFSKLFNALTEEDPEEADSDENKNILDELDTEEKTSKKKKGKKGKPDKKKGKNAEADEEDEDDEDGKSKGKGGKEKKPKKVKPKKEKPPKLKPAYEPPSRRISKKSILVVVLFAATVFAVLFFATNNLSAMLQLNSAKAAFDKQDYATCYEKMYGMELSEKEKEMFKHAELVLKMQRRIAVYEKYLAEEMELEALDSLMRGVASYEEMYIEGQSYGAGPEIHAYYMEIIGILESRYGLSQGDAIAIATCESNVDYTRYLTALVGGETVAPGTGGSVTLPEEGLDDLLPAEEELPPRNFAD